MRGNISIGWTEREHSRHICKKLSFDLHNENIQQKFVCLLLFRRFAFSDSTELTNNNNFNVYFFLFTYHKYVIGVIAYCVCMFLLLFDD